MRKAGVVFYEQVIWRVATVPVCSSLPSTTFPSGVVKCLLGRAWRQIQNNSVSKDKAGSVLFLGSSTWWQRYMHQRRAILSKQDKSQSARWSSAVTLAPGDRRDRGGGSTPSQLCQDEKAHNTHHVLKTQRISCGHFHDFTAPCDTPQAVSVPKAHHSVVGTSSGHHATEQCVCWPKRYKLYFKGKTRGLVQQQTLAKQNKTNSSELVAHHDKSRWSNRGIKQRNPLMFHIGYDVYFSFAVLF